MLAEKALEKFRDISLGAILAGSVAYSPNISVTEKSDVDLIAIVENLKSALPRFIEGEKERKALQNRFFEGYCIKKEEQGVPVSIHVLSDDAFDIISKCFVADIRVYRPNSKEGSYRLKGFEGNSYDYHIKNVSLTELKGIRTITPVSFINQDRYYIGIHRDKLLSHPRIMYEQDRYISNKIDKLWTVIVQNLYDEAIRLYGHLDLDRMNVLNALAKRDKMCQDALESIKDKTEFYSSKIK